MTKAEVEVAVARRMEMHLFMLLENVWWGEEAVGSKRYLFQKPKKVQRLFPDDFLSC